MKTVLITGCSSGFGLETARYFLDRGWNVAATMRTPRGGLLPDSEHLRLIRLDVTDAESIRQTVEAAGTIDVLVNNAGIGWFNALEGTTMDMVRHVFETNTIGTMAMTQAVLPQFRQRKEGVIVNITSAVTLKPPRLMSVYSASKAAVEAFTEGRALQHPRQTCASRTCSGNPSRRERTGADGRRRFSRGLFRYGTGRVCKLGTGAGGPRDQGDRCG